MPISHCPYHRRSIVPLHSCFQLSYMSLIFACFVRQAMCIRPESARRGPPFIAEDILCPRDFPGPGKMINIILTVLMSGDRVLS